MSLNNNNSAMNLSKSNSTILMPFNSLNNIYEQILQRNLLLFNQQQQQQQQQQQILEYQIRCRSLMNNEQININAPIIRHLNENSNQIFSNKIEEPKPTQSYIGLIAMAILSSPEKKLVLSDIYQWISDNYLYFRNRGPGWRNSIRHNLSLNDCFIKCDRSTNGKGHFWAIHPANLEDFSRGDFRRRRAQRRVRKSLGLAIPDGDEDDDEFEIDDIEYDDELAVSSLSSLSPVQKNSLKRKRNLKNDNNIKVAEKRVKKETSRDEIIKQNNGFSDDNNSISDQSVSDYNTTTEEIEDIDKKIVSKQKRCFDVDALLAPDDNREIKRLKTTDAFFHTKMSQLDNTTTTNISSSSSSSSSSTTSISSTISSPASTSPLSTQTQIDSNQTEILNFNQSLLNAASLYRNYSLLAANNSQYLYQLQTTVSPNNNNNNNNNINNSNIHEINEETNKKKINYKQQYKQNNMKNNNESSSSSSSKNIDVEKWNQTFSKIMARSYKNHTNGVIIANALNNSTKNNINKNKDESK